jgi:hypothetical protein
MISRVLAVWAWMMQRRTIRKIQVEMMEVLMDLLLVHLLVQLLCELALASDFINSDFGVLLEKLANCFCEFLLIGY